MEGCCATAGFVTRPTLEASEVRERNVGLQAQAEANYDLGVSLSSAWTLGVSSPINPLFDIDDVCTSTDPYLGLVAQKFIVDQVTTSIRYDAADTVSGRVIASGS